jgi:hypothetical protein
MNTSRRNALIATLTRINDQIVTFDALLLNSLSADERVEATDELAYLKIERRKAAASLRRIH